MMCKVLALGIWSGRTSGLSVFEEGFIERVRFGGALEELAGLVGMKLLKLYPKETWK